MLPMPKKLMIAISLLTLFSLGTWLIAWLEFKEAGEPKAESLVWGGLALYYTFFTFFTARGIPWARTGIAIVLALNMVLQIITFLSVVLNSWSYALPILPMILLNLAILWLLFHKDTKEFFQ